MMRAMLFMGLMVCAMAAPAAAETRTVDGAQTATELRFFEAPEASKPALRVPVGEIAFPLKVMEEAPNKRLRVQYQGRNLWLNSGDVRLSGVALATGPCVPTKQGGQGLGGTAGVRGWGANCK